MAAPEREHVCECNVHYNAKKMEAEVWSSFSLACSSERYSLPPKLDMKTVIIDTSGQTFRIKRRGQGNMEVLLGYLEEQTAVDVQLSSHRANPERGNEDRQGVGRGPP